MASIGMHGIPRLMRTWQFSTLRRRRHRPKPAIALRYGTLPIVHATGGLADTVTDLDANPSTGNGVSFTPYEASALLDALHRALRLYAERDRWPDLIARAMAYDSRWSSSARAYSQLYRRVLSLPA